MQNPGVYNLASVILKVNIYFLKKEEKRTNFPPQIPEFPDSRLTCVSYFHAVVGSGLTRTLRKVVTFTTDSGSITTKTSGERSHRLLWSTTTGWHTTSRHGQDRFIVAEGKQKWTVASAEVSGRRTGAKSTEKMEEETINTASDSEQTPTLDLETTKTGQLTSTKDHRSRCRSTRTQCGCSTSSALHRRSSSGTATMTPLTSTAGKSKEDPNHGDESCQGNRSSSSSKHDSSSSSSQPPSWIPSCPGKG